MATLGIMKILKAIMYFNSSGGSASTCYRKIQDGTIRATDGGNRRIYASAYTPGLNFSDSRNSMYLGAS